MKKLFPHMILATVLLAVTCPDNSMAIQDDGYYRSDCIEKTPDCDDSIISQDLEKTGPDLLAALIKSKTLSEEQKIQELTWAIKTYGIDLNTVDTKGYTPLFHAACRGFNNIIILLLKNGALIDQKVNAEDDGRTALHVASTNGEVDTVRLLLDNNAKIDTVDHEGWSALHYAALKGHSRTVRLLVEYGANINKKTADGAKPYDVAIAKKHMGVVAYLELANLFYRAVKNPSTLNMLVKKYIDKPAENTVKLPITVLRSLLHLDTTEKLIKPCFALLKEHDQADANKPWYTNVKYSYPKLMTHAPAMHQKLFWLERCYGQEEFDDNVSTYCNDGKNCDDEMLLSDPIMRKMVTHELKKSCNSALCTQLKTSFI